MTKTQDQKPKTDDAVVAILLAAGQSRRMGAFKPLLPFGKTTVIQSCIDNLQAGGVADIVVVLGHRAAEVQASLANFPDLQFTLNPDPDSEMSASIACGVRDLPSTVKAILIALTDEPAVPPEVIQTLIREWIGGAKLVVPQFQGHGGHPVLIDLGFREQLLALDQQRGLRALFDANRSLVQRPLVNSPYIARDMDTWDDYRTLHLDVFGSLPAKQGS
jgi:molybdenum cofactor cytidylyltransferase